MFVDAIVVRWDKLLKMPMIIKNILLVDIGQISFDEGEEDFVVKLNDIDLSKFLHLYITDYLFDIDVVDVTYLLIMDDNVIK